jgi:hypothetical protein
MVSFHLYLEAIGSVDTYIGGKRLIKIISEALW